MKVAPRCKELVKTDTVYRVTQSLCLFEPGSPLNQLSPAQKISLLLFVFIYLNVTHYCVPWEDTGQKEKCMTPLSSSASTGPTLSCGRTPAFFIYLAVALTTNDNRWCLESWPLCVVPTTPEKGALFQKNGPPSIPPCPSVTPPPSTHTHTHTHTHTGDKSRLQIQWALCNSWMIHSPPIYGQHVQRKGPQVLCLQLQIET